MRVPPRLLNISKRSLSKVKMTPDEFEDHLAILTDDEYSLLMEGRIARLNPEQQVLAQAREDVRKERFKLISKFNSSETSWEEIRESLVLIGKDFTGECEHGRSYCKHCVACGEIDYLMF